MGVCHTGALCCSCPELQMFASEMKPLAAGSIQGQPHHGRVVKGLQAAMAMQEPGEPSQLALVPGG